MTKARETAKERNARIDAENAARLAARKAAYPQRFREVLGDALREGFELDSVDAKTGGYKLNLRGAEDETHMIFDTPGDAAMSEYPLEDLERAVLSLRNAREEVRRKYELRVATLAKLTAEEREALGV